MSSDAAAITVEISPLAKGLASLCAESPCWDTNLLAPALDGRSVEAVAGALSTVRSLADRDLWCALALLVDTLRVAAAEELGEVALVAAELAQTLYEEALKAGVGEELIPRLATAGFVLAEQAATLVMDPKRVPHPGALRRVAVSANRVLRLAGGLWVSHTSTHRLPEEVLRRVGARESAAVVALHIISSPDTDSLFSLASSEWAKHPEDPGVLAVVARAFRHANLHNYSQLLDLHLTLRRLYEGTLEIPAG